MAEQMVAPRRNPYASAGGMVVGAIVVVLLTAFAVNRLSGPHGIVDASHTGSSKPDDVIMARQLLMDSNETAMGPIDRAAGGQDIALASLKDQAYTIYTNLSIAPHLFPIETKPVVSPDGSAPSTAATPAVWANFDMFYDTAAKAANVAYDASQAADIGKFRDLAKQLRMSCDGCHATYMHVFDPSTGK
jgi:cytochrome c556